MRTCFPAVDTLLATHAAALGADLPGYRNHVYRVLNFTQALVGARTLPESVEVAAAFHDLGIWTDGTFDYLEPSARRARAYLAAQPPVPNAPALDPDEIVALVMEHHRLRPYRGPYAPWVEAFRRADFVDVTLGLVRFGIPRPLVTAVRSTFPNAGFHRRLVALTLAQWRRAPLRPLPMLRW